MKKPEVLLHAFILWHRNSIYERLFVRVNDKIK